MRAQVGGGTLFVGGFAGMIALFVANEGSSSNLWCDRWFQVSFTGAVLLFLVGLYVAGSAYLPLPMPRTLEEQRKEAPGDSREELLSFLKAERKNIAPVEASIAGGLAGSDYRDVRAEIEAWAVGISRRLREYDQELARVFNEDDRRYTSLDLRGFLDRRLQQLGEVIAVLERRRDSPGL